MSTTPKSGAITWQDLTVEDAEALRDFYAAVVGWTPEPVKMGDYADFTMKADTEPVAGICHARGSNAGLPAQWLVYVTVDDLDHSIDECIRLGGAVIAAPRGLAGGRFCVIRDPAGAVCALYQPPDAA
jgi:predicted enzyme related to lactoylglutathione lyase